MKLRVPLDGVDAHGCAVVLSVHRRTPLPFVWAPVDSPESWGDAVRIGNKLVELNGGVTVGGGPCPVPPGRLQ